MSAIVTPGDLLAFLRAAGWRETRRFDDGVAVFTATAQPHLAVDVPLSTAFDDYDRAVETIIAAVARVEEQPLMAIRRRLTELGADLGAFRFSKADADGAMALNRISTIFSAIADGLGAAACSVDKPDQRAFHVGKSRQAQEFLAHLRFAGVAPGSLIIHLRSEVEPDAQPSLLEAERNAPENLDAAPFERRALALFAQAGADAVAFASAAESIDRAPRRVSSNLCEALAVLAEWGGDVEMSFAWSARRAAPAAPRRVRVPRILADDLRCVAEALRRDEPEEDAEVYGEVVEAQRSYDKADGRIVIKGLVKKRLRSLTVELPERLYGQAIAAHDNRKRVLITGQLKARPSGRIELRNVTSFEIIEEDSDAD